LKERDEHKEDHPLLDYSSGGGCRVHGAYGRRAGCLLAPYDPQVPVLCMNEQPVQLVEEVRQPIAATRHYPKRVDYEYKRAGVANVFMFTEPLAEWREVSVRTAKTKVDWATEMAQLLKGRCAHYQKVILVCDNLNTHTKGAFYECFRTGASP